MTGNSLKPNSAVRQLFPNPKFVSPPPVPFGKLISSTHALDDSQDDSTFLVTTDNSHFYGATKKSKISENQTVFLHEETTNPIKKTIERNTLRRTLLDKYRTNSRKKILPSKNLSLEERIRQLTCVDQEEDNICQNSIKDVIDSSNTEIDTEFFASIHSPLSKHKQNKLLSTETLIHNTAGINEMSTVTTLSTSIPVTMKFNALSDLTTMTTTTTTTAAMTTMLISNSSFVMTTATTTAMTTTIASSNYYKQTSSASNSPILDNIHNHSTYKKLTDLFIHKKNISSNLPDLGLGNNGKNNIAKDNQQSKNSLKTNNSDVRKQFLASLAPLSCVTVNDSDNQEDYYQYNSRMENRDSTVYNTYNAFSPYNLEDIKAVFCEKDRNNVEPDITKGTPTNINKPDVGDSTTDELLAFIEQDKFRTCLVL